MASDAFYRQLDEGRFASTPHTAGPWGPTAQHGGPPAALLARTMLATANRPELHLPRVSFEILAPVPVDEVEVTAAVVRPGRVVTLVEGTLSAGGRPAMVARAWLCVPSPDEGRDALAPLPHLVHQPPADDVEVPQLVAWPGSHGEGYLQAIDWVHTDGDFAAPGAGGSWLRPNVELVEGTATSPWERALIVADSGSGVGLSHDLNQVMAVNIDLNLFFDRRPRGRWIHLDAHTTGTSGGGSFSSTVLGDSDGVFGRGVQSLCVQALPR